jgi:hypothetical protein
MLPITRDPVAAKEYVGECATNKKVGLGSESPTKDRREVGSGSESPRKDRRVRFAVDMPAAEPTRQQDRRAPIKMVGGRAWSPGIYRSLRLLGKSLDVAWERAFIHPLTFN